jgi:hypothetical protein
MGAGKARRTSRAVRRFVAAFNVAGRSPEKTAFRVASLQRRTRRENSGALVAIVNHWPAL